jgi:hypothetical protein
MSEAGQVPDSASAFVECLRHFAKMRGVDSEWKWTSTFKDNSALARMIS